MRTVLAMAAGLALGLAGCAEDASDKGCEWKGVHHELGEVFADDCNGCTCTEDGVTCSLVNCEALRDAAIISCMPELPCTEGPVCVTTCCAAGEKCVNDVCTCAGTVCGAGDHCAAAGPAGPDGCGSVCCGASGPCPQ